MRKNQWNRIRNIFAGALIFISASSTIGGAGGGSGIDFHGSFFSWRAPSIDWRELLEKIAMVESGNNPKAYRRSEGARGRLQITEAALADVNAWAGTNIRPAELFNPETCDFVGGYYLAVILYTNRCAGNLYRAVASWNIGFSNVRAGWYPADYLAEVFEGEMFYYLRGYRVIEERRNHFGRRLVRVAK